MADQRGAGPPVELVRDGFPAPLFARNPPDVLLEEAQARSLSMTPGLPAVTRMQERLADLDILSISVSSVVVASCISPELRRAHLPSQRGGAQPAGRTAVVQPAGASAAFQRPQVTARRVANGAGARTTGPMTGPAWPTPLAPPVLGQLVDLYL